MRFLKAVCLRWRLWRICRRLGIKPYSWQRDFVLGITDHLEYPPGRRTGKTTAVLLKLMVVESSNDVIKTLRCDPDFSLLPKRVDWYFKEHSYMARLCDFPCWDIRCLAWRERYLRRISGR